MIKCTYFSKLLKQSLFTLLIGFFGFGVGSSVNAMENGVSHNIGTSFQSAVNNSSINLSVLPKGSFISTYFGQGKAVFSPVAIKGNTDDSNSTSKIIYFFWNNKRPYVYYYVKSNNSLYFTQGYLTTYSVCNYFSSSTTLPSGCSTNSITSEGDVELLTSFLSSVSLDDSYYYYTNVDNISYTYPYLQFCISSSQLNSSVCFQSASSTTCSSSVCQPLTGSLGLMPNLSFADLSSSVLDNPPSLPQNSENSDNQVIGGDDIEGFNYIGTDEENLVSYFEDNSYYKFDENICYVGTDDFSLYFDLGNNPLFYKGQGSNIFDLYSFLFGNNFTIKDIGIFINTRQINYNSRYKGDNRDEDGNIMYNAGYSRSSGFYQDFSDNLYNPFYGERLAVYFMALNTTSYGRQSTLGEQIATYCYYKLGNDVNTGYAITDNSDSSYRNNAGEFSQNLRRFKTYFSGSNSIQSQSRAGTPLQYLSGDDDLDFSTFFSKSFNRFKDSFNINPSDYGAGFLPTYIILFLLAIIVFRFISH